MHTSCYNHIQQILNHHHQQILANCDIINGLPPPFNGTNRATKSQGNLQHLHLLNNTKLPAQKPTTFGSFHFSVVAQRTRYKYNEGNLTRTHCTNTARIIANRFKIRACIMDQLAALIFACHTCHGCVVLEIAMCEGDF